MVTQANAPDDIFLTPLHRAVYWLREREAEADDKKDYFSDLYCSVFRALFNQDMHFRAALLCDTTDTDCQQTPPSTFAEMIKSVDDAVDIMKDGCFMDEFYATFKDGAPVGDVPTNYQELRDLHEEAAAAAARRENATGFEL